MAISVMWMAATGYDQAHLLDHLPARSTKREALADMEAAELHYPVRHAQVARLEFDSPLKPAVKVDIIVTRSADTELAAA